MSLISPGTIIADRYEVVELLGMGGHGAVYRALQRPLGREVALKTILVEALAGDGALERFTREAKVVQGLEHPHTVRLFDFGTTREGMPFSVFELLRGPTLEQEIAQGPLTPHRVGRIASQILKSLMEAHAKGIVHRDVKPSNVLLLDYFGEKDFVKVLDFGVARPILAPAPRDAITHAGQIIGTPAYMAPEQVHEGAIGPASDLYALGLVMAEALAGRPVYADGSPIQIWMQQTSPDPVPLPPSVTGSPFGAVIARATRKAIRERYATAAEMLADIEQVATRVSASGTAETAPLAAPMRAPAAPTAPIAPAAPTAPIAPAAPFVVASTYGPGASLVPPSARGGEGSRPLVWIALGGLAVVVLVGIVLVAGVGGALLASRPDPGPKTITPPTSTAGSTLAVPASGRLRAVNSARVEQRLRAAGWSVTFNHQSAENLGFQTSLFSATKGVTSATIQLYEYESPQIAAQTASTLESSPAGGVVLRDGGRVLYVAVLQDVSQSRALFDEIVRP
ncbi:MAG: serine/threonine protein kinase [Deltaproteobacteria bacterium]|nr:serine/threonine protein kinase [Deltaproteobacteria bacterium]